MSRKKHRNRPTPRVEQASLPIEPAVPESLDALDALDANASGADRADVPDAPHAANVAIPHDAEPVADAQPDAPVAVATAPDAAPGNRATDAPVAESRLETGRPGDGHGSVGARLRAAREALGLTRSDLSRTTRLPGGVIADIEADHFARLGASIYVRGYLRTYAKAVGVPDVVVNHAVDRIADEAQPQLVVSHPTPRSTYLARRYGNSLNYVVLTAVIVVPLLWLARQNTITTDVLPKFEPLDAPAEIQTDAPLAAPASSLALPAPAPDPGAIAAGPPEPAGDETPAAAMAEEPPLQPVMASMAPRSDAAAPQAQRIVLRLAQPSWIEFTGANGDRIEYALLPAGTVREYQVVGTADLRIGNTRGARLEIDGSAVDLAPYTRSNVARVSVGRAPAGG